MIPIFIPSKGRHNNVRTAKLLDEIGLNYTLVVEPQEENLYRQLYSNANIMVLPDNNRGVVYVFNYILDNNDGLFCLIDDDINSFGYVKNKRCVNDTNAFKNFLKYCEVYDGCFAQYAMNYRQYAWTSKTSYDINSLCEVCVVIDKKKVGLCRYDKDIYPQDRDFTLQLIASGKKTLKFNHLWFSCPSIGANNGGQYNFYNSPEYTERLKMLENKWGNDLVDIIKKKDGTLNAKINLKNIEKWQ